MYVAKTLKDLILGVLLGVVVYVMLNVLFNVADTVYDNYKIYNETDPSVRDFGIVIDSKISRSDFETYNPKYKWGYVAIGGYILLNYIIWYLKGMKKLAYESTIVRRRSAEEKLRRKVEHQNRMIEYEEMEKRLELEEQRRREDEGLNQIETTTPKRAKKVSKRVTASKKPEEITAVGEEEEEETKPKARKVVAEKPVKSVEPEVEETEEDRLERSLKKLQAMSEAENKRAKKEASNNNIEKSRQRREGAIPPIKGEGGDIDINIKGL